MKKYMLILFVLAVACAFSLSAVAATSFEKQDFDGKFKMDVIKGSNLKKTEDDGIISFMDEDKSLLVMYYADQSIKKNLSDNEFDEFQKASGFNADGKDGDIRVYKKDKFYGAMAVDEGIMVVVGYNNRTDAVDMAKSIEFTK